MLKLLETFENSLDSLFCKKVPIQLSDKSRRTIVDIMPWVNLFLGILSLLATLSLWRWSHATQASIDYLNQLNQQLGGRIITVHRLTFVVWLSIIILLAQSLLFLMAISPTRKRQKAGWNMLYYAFIINIIYGLIITLSAYDGGGRLMLSILTSGLGLYFIFQIRHYYLGRKATIKSVN